MADNMNPDLNDAALVASVKAKSEAALALLQKISYNQVMFILFRQIYFNENEIKQFS